LANRRDLVILCRETGSGSGEVLAPNSTESSREAWFASISLKDE
jgi:hypothetical protein